MVHDHDHPCNEELGHVAIRSLSICQQFKTLLYPHTFVTAEDIQGTLGGLLTSTLYAWNTCKMGAAARSFSPHPVSSTGLHTTNVAAVGSDADDVV